MLKRDVCLASRPTEDRECGEHVGKKLELKGVDQLVGCEDADKKGLYRLPPVYVLKDIVVLVEQKGYLSSLLITGGVLLFKRMLKSRRRREQQYGRDG
jgi:hypothetical protein